MDMGNYPKYCKLMTISNGALNGKEQTRSWDNGIRTPNDLLMAVNNETYLRILGIKILGTYNDLALHTNPDGNGKLIGLSMGVTHWKIKLKWFGVKLVYDRTELLNVSKYGKGLLPYCTSAGSTVTSGGFGSANSSFEMPNWVQMFLGLNVTYSSLGQGKIKVGSSVGLPFFANMNADIILQSDGFDFGFIPTQSSLDFLPEDPKDLSLDIKNKTTSYIMGRTPFDVLITRPFDNFGHLSMDNSPYYPYQTCSNDSIECTPVSREIGDDSLFVESITFGFPQLWEAEKGVLLGARNPYYNYPDMESAVTNYGKSALPLIHLYLARHTPVLTNNKAIFRANGSVAPSIVPSDVVGGYQVQQGLMQLCCVNYRARQSADGVNNATSGYLHIVPNPINSSSNFTLHYKFAQNGAKTRAEIYTINGGLIASLDLPFINQTLESYYQVSTKDVLLKPGMYIVRISNGIENYSSKLIVIH